VRSSKLTVSLRSPRNFSEEGKQQSFLYSLSLSLSLSSHSQLVMVDKMDAQITLTTSDDPPISLTISRSALVTHSKVFADMLSLDLKGGKAGGPVPFDEPEDIIRVFVLMAEGREEELKGALSKVDEKGWLALAAFADKYDSWGMRNLVVLKGW